MSVVWFGGWRVRSAGVRLTAKLRFSKRKPFIYDTLVVLTTNKLRALSDDNNPSNKSPRPNESFVKFTAAVENPPKKYYSHKCEKANHQKLSDDVETSWMKHLLSSIDTTLQIYTDTLT